jgi:hypothetical protein
VLDPPRIPGSRTLFEQFEMAGVSHRVHPRTVASMPWLQVRAVWERQVLFKGTQTIRAKQGKIGISTLKMTRAITALYFRNSEVGSARKHLAH